MADPHYLASRLNINTETLTSPHLSHRSKVTKSNVIKSHFQSMENSDIVAIVKDAPLRNWIQNSESFEDFYNDMRDLSQRMKWNIPNERENV